MTDYALAADMGGTRLRVALVDRSGAIKERHATDTLAHEGKDAVLDRLISALSHVASKIDRELIAGIGVSMPGATVSIS